jgi:hypothetical protein
MLTFRQNRKFGKSPSLLEWVMRLVLALEGLSESLEAELDPAWNTEVLCSLRFIYTVRNLSKVTILEPGPYRTKIFERSWYRIAPEHKT